MRSLRIVDDDLAPEQFIIPARNAKGETERQWFRCSPELDRDVSEIVSSKKFPFKTPGDLMRFCVHHGVKWLGKTGAIKTDIQVAEMMHAFLLDEDRQQLFMDNITLARTVVERMVNDGDLPEARRIILKLRKDIEGMPPGYWRKKYTKKLTEQFGHLLESKGRAAVPLLRNVRPPDEDEDPI